MDAPVMNRRRNSAFFVASCISNNAPMAGGLACPPMRTTANAITRNGGMVIFGNDRRAGIRIVSMSMTSSGEELTSEESHDEYDDDDDDMRMFQRISSRRPRANILGEFDIIDETIDWEPLDIDEMDDFFDELDYPGDEYVDIDDETGELLRGFDEETLLEIRGLEDDGGGTVTISDEDRRSESERFRDSHHGPAASSSSSSSSSPYDDDRAKEGGGERTTRIDGGGGSSRSSSSSSRRGGLEDLERALMRGVVPAEAGVGSGMLPGDDGFDPLGLSTRDYFKLVQNFILGLLPARRGGGADDGGDDDATSAAAGFAGGEDGERPPALILRDYREAEIRHGRLAMLAAAIWPLQEILDRIFIPDSFGSMTIVYGGPTLPFLPLVMTFAMLNLGYLDIYSSEIKENESGDAFLPGECFWDPLCILEGAPDTMKRNMQEREILNGRAAMIAVAAYAFEEAMTHVPIVGLPTNALLFEPAYQVPFIQQWLDMQFGEIDYSVYIDPGI